MDEVLKRRLVGGIVLMVVLMAVTFFFFSGSEDVTAPGTVEVSVDGTRSYSLDVPVEQQTQGATSAAPTTLPGTLPAAPASDAAGQAVKPEEGMEEITMTAPPADVNEAPAKSAAATTTLSPPPPAGESQAVQKVPDAAESNPAPKPATKAPVKKATKPAVTVKPPETTTGEWAVQTGSFASQSNAVSSQKKLTSLGYRSFLSKTQGQSPVLYRVRVGPYASEAAAKASAAKLRVQLKQDVKVVANR